MAIKPVSPTDIQFNRGIRQDLEGKLAPPGALVTAENVEFDKLGRLQRRNSFTAIGESTYAKTTAYTSPARRFALGPKGERLIFTDEATHFWNEAANKLAIVGSDGVPAAQRARLFSVGTSGGDQSGTIKASDCAYYGNFLVIAYVAYGLASGTNSYNLYLDIIDTTTGDHVVMGKYIANVVTAMPRVVICGTKAVIVYQYSIGNIYYFTVDLGASSISVGAAAQLLSDQDTVINCFDIAPTYSGNFVIAYSAFASSVHRVHVSIYNSSGTIQQGPVAFTTSTGAAWTPTYLAVVGSSTGSDKVFVCGYDSVTFKLETWIADYQLASPSKAAQDPGLNHSFPVRQLAATRRDSTNFIIAFSNYLYQTTSDGPAGHLYFRMISNGGTFTSINPVANYTLGSRFFHDTANDDLYCFARFNDPSEAQSHLLLLSFGKGSSAIFPFPEFHVASGRITKADYAATTTMLPIGGIADITSSKPGQFVMAYPIRLGASTISGTQIGLYTVQLRGHDRFLSTQAQGGLLVAGGTPLVYDGQRLVEMGFYSYPPSGAGMTTKNTTNGSIAQGIYQYCWTYEWVDGVGNVMRSPPSPAVTVDMSSGTYVANTNSVTLALPSLHATRKQRSFSTSGNTDIYSRVRVVAYRTTASGSNFYRVGSTDPTTTVTLGGVTAGLVGLNNTDTTADTSIIDTLSDASLSVNEQLYTQRGELSTTAPPACSFMTVHDGRAWGIDDEQPERIWFTKTFATLESPGYNPGLQILIPGSGKIRGIAGQDGKTYALTENGIYLAAYGDGPDNTGQGAFPSPQLITADANCTDSRGVLVARDGIYFVGTAQAGTTVYLIRRGDGTPIDIGRRIRDEIANSQSIAGIIERADKNRIEFLFVEKTSGNTNPAQARLMFYHPDLLDEEGIGQWTSGSYLGNASPLTCLGQWTVSNATTSVAYDCTNSKMATMTANAGCDLPGTGSATEFYSTLETTDIRPFGAVGYGEVDSVSILATCRAACSTQIKASFDSGNTWTATQSWTTAESAGYPLIRRWEPPTKKLPKGSIRVRITDSQGSAVANLGAIWHGISLELTQIGGNARLAANQKG